MPRTALTKSAAAGSYPSAGVTLTMDAGDSSNNNDFAFGGNELLVVKNAHATVAKVLTVVSAADDMGRTADIASSIAAGVVRIYGPFTDKTGWQQSSNKFHLNPVDNNLKIGVLSLP